MQQLFASGLVADVLLVVMAVEAVLVLLFARPRGPMAVSAFAGNLLAGASLVVALRLALTAADWRLMAAALLVSLAGHLTDLYARVCTR